MGSEGSLPGAAGKRSNLEAGSRSHQRLAVPLVLPDRTVESSFGLIVMVPLAGPTSTSSRNAILSNMNYAVKELFYSLQGEGAQTGRPSVFCRFTGCNLWTGREDDRATAICRFCDTDFRGIDGAGGGRFGTASDLALAAAEIWPHGAPGAWLVCTGGEPTLHSRRPDRRVSFVRVWVAIETNGTLPLPDGLDWVCVSPEAGGRLLRVCRGNELKVVFPQPGLDLDALLALEFEHFFLQPMDSPELATNTEMATRYCLEHPPWRLSQQAHKRLGLP